LRYEKLTNADTGSHCEGAMQRVAECKGM